VAREPLLECSASSRRELKLGIPELAEGHVGRPELAGVIVPAMFAIGEVARRAGIAASAIRYYERQGLVPRADRRGGKRVYDEDILDRLALIQLAKSAGFRVAEIQTLLRGFGLRTPPGPRWRALAERKVAELEARSAEVERMKRVLEVVARCECPTLGDCSRALRG
jgi:MerR family transcriptional regulator, redox-sensitive transcriptional activator SoxR